LRHGGNVEALTTKVKPWETGVVKSFSIQPIPRSTQPVWLYGGASSPIMGGK